MRIRLALVAALGVLASLPGCGSDGSAARDAVSETSNNLGRIRSGELDTRFEIRAEGADDPGAVGFALRGPFSLTRKGGLPNARIAYTQTAGTERAQTTVIADGRDAYVEAAGQAYELPARECRQLELGPDVRSASGGSLRVERWLIDPSLADGPSVAGAPTDRITGRLDVARAVNDLLGLADRAGAEAAGLEPLRGARAQELKDAVRSSDVEVLTGREDRLLRRLTVEVELDAPEREGGGSLPKLDAVRFELDLSLARPNEPVKVDAPRNARPFAELGSDG